MKSKKILTLVAFSSILGTTFFSATPTFASEIIMDNTIQTVVAENNSNEYSNIINIPDKNLAKQINTVLKHEPTAPITQKDADSITEFNLTITKTMPIENLQGLSQLHNLELLTFNNSTNVKIENLSEICRLHNLETLVFSSSVDDLAFLKGNTSIKYLSLFTPNQKDLSALIGMDLYTLSLYQCSDSVDLSILTQFKHLSYLEIKDLSFSESRADVLTILQKTYQEAHEGSNYHPMPIYLPYDWYDKISKLKEEKKASLKKEIELAEAINENLYTPDSIDNLKDAITLGKHILIYKWSLFADFDKATQDIKNAVKNLKDPLYRPPFGIMIGRHHH